MKHKIFVIYDAKANAYLPPFFLPTAGMAIRSFGDCVLDDKHNFGKHPEDYSLFCAGEFDDGSGVFSVESTLLVVATGLELRGRLALEAELVDSKVREIAAGDGKKPGSLPVNGLNKHV